MNPPTSWSAGAAALGDVGIDHVVVIARGRPLDDADLNHVAAAADQLVGLAHTPG
jgi:hypothetical protein